MSTERTPASREPAVRIVPKHHLLVRISHWLTLPLLFLLTLSGLAIYWASPVLRHAPEATTGNTDYVVDVGGWLSRHLQGSVPSPTFLYDHFSIGTGQLALALRLHWLAAYLFMACGALYVTGLVAGGGYKALLPRRADFVDAARMIRYYAGRLPMALRRRPWPHPPVRGKYNALQRGAYASMGVAGALAVASGWAMHKPSQLGWLARLFGSYDGARVWHFWLMVFFAAFVVPHVVLVVADGWDTFRSMVTGWSRRAPASPVPTSEVPPPAPPTPPPAESAPVPTEEERPDGQEATA
jgi:thiosulfate reductase cytochrome b subunit